ncbi:MAG: hypothetical protein AAF656_12640, partial [Planctomycetota bacterium]
SLNVDGCTFEQGLVLRDARIDGNCRLRSCEFEDEVYKFLDFRRLHVTGRLNLACSTSHVGIDLTSLTCADEVRLDGLHAPATIKTEADIDLPTDAAPGLKQHLIDTMIGVAVQMRGADIRRDLLLFKIDGRPTKLTGSANFRAKVGMNVTFSGAVVDAGKGSKAVDMDGADVGGSVYFNNGTHLTGYVDLRAKVGGQVVFEDAKVLAEPGSMAVDMETADVGRAVFFRDSTHLTGYVDLRAKVGGQVAFDNATILAEPWSRAVNMETAEVGTAVFFHNRTHLTGYVDLRAKVGGQVVFEDATVLAEPNSMAVMMETADVGGILVIRNRTLLVGRVNASLAKLRAGLWCNSSIKRIVWGRPGSAKPTVPVKPCNLRVGGIDLSFAEVFGPVNVHAASVSGPIVARHLKVHGEMDVCGSVFGPRTLSDDEKKLAERSTDKSKSSFGDWGEAAAVEPIAGEPRAIDLDMAQIEGRLWLKGSRVLGDVYAEDVEVTGEVNLDQAQVLGDVTLRSAKVHGRVFNDASAGAPSPQVRGKVDLSYAEVEQVDLKFGHGDDVLMPSYVDLSAAKCGSLQLRGELDCGEDLETTTRIGADGLTFETLDCSELSGIKKPIVTWRDKARLILMGLVGVMSVAFFAVGGSPLGLLMMVILTHVGLMVWMAGPRRPWSAREMQRGQSDLPEQLGLFTLLHKSYPFSAGFYRRVEQWLREISNDAVADEVFLSNRKREASPPRSGAGLPAETRKEADRRGGPLRRLWMFALDFFVGYGVRPQRLVTAYLLLWLLSTAVFSSRKSVERPLVFVQPATDAESA